MKKLLSLLFISLFAVSLSGCRKKVVNDPEIMPLSNEELKAADKVTIKFWHSFGDLVGKELEARVKAFKEVYPNVNVKLDSVGGGYDGLRQRMVLGIPQKELPDMVLGYPDHFAEYLQGGILVNLSTYINSKEKGVGLSDDEINDFVKSYWDENSKFDDEGNVYGIPFNKSTEIMTYNATIVNPILQQKGYATVVNGKVQWLNPTWDQVMDVGAALKVLYPKDDVWPVSVDSTSNFFITVARQWGGDDAYTVLDGKKANGQAKGKIVFDNEYVKAGLNYFKEYKDQKVFHFPGVWQEKYSSKSFTNEKCFIGIGSTAGIRNNIPQAGKFEIAVTTYPQKSYATDANPSVIQQGTNIAMIYSTTTNLQRAAIWELTKFLTSSAQTAIFSKNTGYMPVRKSVLDSQDYKDFLDGKDFNIEPALAISAANRQTDYLFTDPAFVGSAYIRDRAGKIVDAVFFANKSVNTAISDAYKDLEEYK